MTGCANVPPGGAIVQYWHSEEMPDDVAAMVRSFRDRNPDMHHVLLNERTAEGLIDEHYGGRELEAFRTCAVPAMQADYVRLCALWVLGGVYADVDFRCVRRLSTLRDANLGGTLFGLPEIPKHFRVGLEERAMLGPVRVMNNNLFAFASPRHPLLELAVEMATANIENRVSDNVAMTTGPAIFTALYYLNELGSFEKYLEYVRGSLLEPLAPVFCESVGSRERVKRAFAGVRVWPMEKARPWVLPPESRPAYKAMTSHWIRFDSCISSDAVSCPAMSHPFS